MLNKNLGKLRVRLGLDDAEFRKGLDQNSGRLRVFAKAGAVAVAGMAVTAAGALAVFTRQSFAAIDAQAKLAQSLGTTTGSMQIMERAGELAGVSMSGIEQAAKDMTRRLSQAAESGAGPAAEALGKLGLSAQELMAMPLDQRIAEVNSAIEEFIPAANRAAIAGQIFGEEGSIAMSRIDATTIATATDELEKFGVIIDDVDADKIEAANDAMSRLGLAARGLGNRIAVFVAPALAGLADGLTRLWTGQSRAEQATDNLTIALSDEARQIGAMSATIADGITLSREAALAKLQEAKAIREKIESAREEARQIIMQGDEYRALTAQVAALVQEADSLRVAGDAGAFAPNAARQGLEKNLELLQAALARQRALLAAADLMPEQYAQANQAIAALEVAIAEAKGEQIELNGGTQAGVVLSQRLAANVAGIDFSNSVSGAQALSRQLGVSLQQAMQIMGLVGGAAQARNDPVVFDPRDPRYDAAAAQEAARLERLRQTMADLREEADNVTVEIVEYNTAVSGGGGGGGGAAGGAVAVTEDLAEAQTEAADAAESLGDALRNEAKSGLEEMVEYIFSDGEKSLKGLVRIFGDTLKDMLQLAAKNQIRIGFGLDGSGGLSALGGGGGGGGLLSGVGTKVFGSLGSNLLSASPTFGTGLLGGLGSTLSATIGSGGGVGGLFSIGANAAAAGGGLLATVGAALPIVGLAVGLFSLFKRKPVISAKDFAAIRSGLELSGLEFSNVSKKAAADLKKLSGGVKKFGERSQSYFDNFFTDSEKRQRAIEAIDEVFERLGLQVPRSAEAFRRTVEGLDLTTSAGRKTYAELMRVSEAFAAVYGTAGTAAQGILSTFGGSLFRSAAAEALTTGRINAGADVAFLNVAGGVMRPDERLFVSGQQGGLSPAENARATITMVDALRGIERRLNTWDLNGVPPAQGV